MSKIIYVSKMEGKKEARTHAWQSDKSMAFFSRVQTTPERTTPRLSLTVQRFFWSTHMSGKCISQSFFVVVSLFYFFFLSSIFVVAVWFPSIVKGNDKYWNMSSNQFYKWLARGSRTGSKVPTKVNTFFFFYWVPFQACHSFTCY